MSATLSSTMASSCANSPKEMGFFDFLKTRAPAPPAPSESPFEPGRDAIDAAFAELYPGQNARHWSHNGVMRMHDLQNPPENPFDSVSIYDGGSFWHYVSFGLSDLYARESEDEWSGFGFELTFRLAKSEEAEPPLWPINVMGSLGRAVFAGSSFAPGHSVNMMKPLDGPRSESAVTAVLLTKDPGLEQVRETPHGKLAFLLIVGVEDSVRQRALADGTENVLTEMRKHNPHLTTRV